MNYIAEEEITTVNLQSEVSKRFVFPVKKFKLDSDTLQRRLPLPNYQYIAPSSDKHEEESKIAIHRRTLFWLKEKLLSILSSSWKIQRNYRHGMVDFSAILLTRNMISKMLVKDFPTQVSVDGMTRTQNSIECSVMQVNSIEISVKNSSGESANMFLRFAPLLRDVSVDNGEEPASFKEKFRVIGMSQQQLPLLEVGERRTVSLKVVFFQPGTFTFSFHLLHQRTGILYWQNKVTFISAD